MRDGRLRGQHRRAHVDVQKSIDVGEAEVHERAHAGDADAIDEDVETAERLGRLVDRSPDRRRIGAVGLDGDRLAALALNRPNDLGGAIGRTLIGDGDIRTLFMSSR